MKTSMGRISTENYELAMEICKGLEATGKYECVLHPGSVDAMRRGGTCPHEIAVFALETQDKTPIGFADKEE